MSDFENNEEYTSENSASANSAEPKAEPNTTYHYSYSNAQSGQSYYSPNSQQNYTQSAQYGTPMQDAAPKKKKNITVTVLIIVAVVCIVFAIIGFAVSIFSINGNETGNNSSTGKVEIESQAEVPLKNSEGVLTVAGVAKEVADSCVGITVYTQTSNYSNFYNYGSSGSGEETASGAGSGILMLEDDGKTYVLTNAHVISDGTKFTVTLNDKTEYDAEMVGYDSQTDIGVLVIKATGLKIADFGDSDQTVQGEQVIAIGCPGGLNFLNSLSSGYVSAVARPIRSSIGYNTECIQIDASINPGNSGGALFNMSGQVIGVNSSKIAATDYEGMGFAIPINTAIATANSIIRVGYVEGRAQLGITYKTISSYSNANSIVNALGQLGFENAVGTMVINSVNEDSDLANKDIQQYDMIVAINGDTLTSTDVMISALASSKPGETVKLTIARIKNNQIDTFEIDCTLIEAKG